MIAEDAETPFVETQTIDNTCLSINYRNHLLVKGSEGNTLNSGLQNEAFMGPS